MVLFLKALIALPVHFPRLAITMSWFQFIKGSSDWDNLTGWCLYCETWSSSTSSCWMNSVLFPRDLEELSSWLHGKQSQVGWPTVGHWGLQGSLMESNREQESGRCCGRNIIQARCCYSSCGQVWKSSPVIALMSSTVFMWWAHPGQQPSTHAAAHLLPTSQRDEQENT